MKLVELKAKSIGNTFFGFGYDSQKLVLSDIACDSLLLKRFKDTRTVYEQYCAGELYLKFSEDTLYTRAAYDHIFDERYISLYPRKNYKINLL